MDRLEKRAMERESINYSIWKSIKSPIAERYLPQFPIEKKLKLDYSKKDKKVKKEKKRKKKQDKKKHDKKKSKRKALDEEPSIEIKVPEKPSSLESAGNIGPMPLIVENAKSSHVSYGKAMLKREGAAIAQFVQLNKRIPRRGEVGWDCEVIEKLESSGYVMSGSRHHAMNAVRIRKENQVYSAEEKQALALIGIEEKKLHEAAVLGEFRAMLTDKLTKKHGADIVEDATS